MNPISYTPLVIASQMTQNLATDQSQLASIEEQLSTGNLVNRPSDDPAAATSIMALNSSVARAQQYSANASDALGWLSLGNSTANQMLNTLQSLQQTVQGLSGANLTGNRAVLTSTASAVTSARTQLINLANTTYNGQPIFAGQGNATQAYSDDASNPATYGTFVGDSTPPTRTVAANTQVATGVTGPQLLGDGTTSPDLVGPGGVLDQLAQDIANAATNPAALTAAETTDLADLNAAITQLMGTSAQLGSSYQQAEAFSQQATNTQQALQTQLTAEDSVDIGKATTQLAQAQQSYQSALWATAQIEGHSLLDYLG
jgi:flagellar hook-associated protein 3 FlgL